MDSALNTTNSINFAKAATSKVDSSASVPDARLVEFSKCRLIPDFAEKAKPFVAEAIEALNRGISDVPKHYGMNVLHWVFIAGDVDAFETVLNKVPDEVLVSLINETNGAKSEDEISYQVDGRVGPAFNKDTPDEILVFMYNHAEGELQSRYETLLDKLKEVLKKGDLKGGAVNNTGNNRFNLSAGGNIETVKWYGDLLRASDDYQECIGNRTNRSVTPMHHAVRSKHPDSFHVLAYLLVERSENAESDLYQQDRRGYMPLRHLKDIDEKTLPAIMGFVKSELERKNPDVTWQNDEYQKLNTLLSTQINQLKAWGITEEELKKQYDERQEITKV